MVKTLKENKPKRVLRDSYISDYFKNGTELFIKLLDELFNGGLDDDFDIVKYFKNWAREKKLGPLEKRWVRVAISEYLIKRKEKDLRRYGRELRLKPTRFDNARKKK
jgi:hypothetical protein